MGCGASAVPFATLPTSSPVSATAGGSPDPIRINATPAHSAPSIMAPGGYNVVAEHKSNPYNSVPEPDALLVSRLMIDYSLYGVQ